MQLSSLLRGIPSVVLCPTKWRDLKEEESLVIFKAYSHWAVMESDYILIRLSASQTICLPGCFHHILPLFLDLWQIIYFVLTQKCFSLNSSHQTVLDRRYKWSHVIPQVGFTSKRRKFKPILPTNPSMRDAGRAILGLS